jgi:hypothetical protein
MLGGLRGENILAAIGSGVFFLLLLGGSGFLTRYYASGTTSISTYFKSFFS